MAVAVKENARISNFLKSAEQAGLIKVKNIVDYRVSSQSDGTLFLSNHLKYLKTTTMSLKVKYLAKEGLSSKTS